MKLPKPKPSRKPSKSGLTKKADTAFSLAMRQSVGFCQAEGKLPVKCGGPLQLCHIETRGNRTLRYDPMNVLIMCAGMHRWTHQHPLQFVEMLLKYYPEQYEYVKKHRNDITKHTVEDYQEIIKYYAAGIPSGH